MNVNGQTARAALLESEETALHAFASARATIAAQEEELRTLRAEILRRDEEYLTEKQVADSLQLSVETIAKARKAGEIEPTFYVRSQPRYARSKLTEIFSAKTKWRKKLKAA